MNLFRYLRETAAELKLVSWPSKQATINLTLIVIAISVVVGLYVGGLDFLFTNALKYYFK